MVLFTFNSQLQEMTVADRFIILKFYANLKFLRRTSYKISTWGDTTKRL